MTNHLTEQPLKSTDAPTYSCHDLSSRFREIRAATEKLCAPLETEDYIAQSMPDASPVKWHLAHTGWFFETFVLKSGAEARKGSDKFAYLFNSYYNAIGDRIDRSKRGLLTRPTVAEVYNYRSRVDDQVLALLDSSDNTLLARLAPLVILGLNHEQQHQELILTDLKHLFDSNPLHPTYRQRPEPPASVSAPSSWSFFPGGLNEIGFEEPGFSFDNELPRHQVYLRPFKLANRLVTSGEYLAFIADGGYDRPEFWLSDGWNTCQAQGWSAPLYWEKTSEGWQAMTLSGVRGLVSEEPVCHVSYYEADAFARWASSRLPTEAEWEVAAAEVRVEGNFLESELFHPRSLPAALKSPAQLFGDAWEWTASPYTPYPGYHAASGALGEYNGKFMCNQMILRGGSCATPQSHIRPTYRNFFPPDARWQFSGIRLAHDAGA